MQDAHIHPVLANQARKHRLLGPLARVNQPQQPSCVPGGQRRVQRSHVLAHAGGQRLRHHLVNQAARDGLLRAREHVQHGALLHHAARIHHCHAVRDLADDLHLVRDQHHRQPQLAVDLLQQRQDGARGFGIERRSGLVREQHLRAAGQRARNAHALLLPAADLRRIAVSQRRKPHQLQQRRHALADFAAAHARQLQRQRRVVKHRARRQQIEMLEHHANLAPRRTQAGWRQRHQIRARHGHPPLCGPVEQIDAAHQRAFARPAAANDAEHLPRLDAQAHPVQRPHGLPAGAGVIQCDVIQRNHGRARPIKSARWQGGRGRLGIAKGMQKRKVSVRHGSFNHQGRDHGARPCVFKRIKSCVHMHGQDKKLVTVLAGWPPRSA